MASMLPESANIAFANATTTVITFFCIVILFAAVGTLTAKVMAPESLSTRKFIHGAFVAIGCLVASKIIM